MEGEEASEVVKALWPRVGGGDGRLEGGKAGVCGQHLTKDYPKVTSSQEMRVEGIDSKS